MSSRIPWDKYEAVFLLSILVMIQEKKISRSKAIAAASEALRERAIKNGSVIDDKFRNINGISLQMMRMLNSLNSRGTISSGSKLFDSVVDLFYNNKAEYQKLVQESGLMISESGNFKDDFFNYVVNRKAGSASKIFLCFDAIDSYALSTGIIMTSIFEKLNNNILETIEYMFENDKAFRKANSKSLALGKMGLTLLKEYIAQNGYPVSKAPEQLFSYADDLKGNENSANNEKVKAVPVIQETDSETHLREKYVDFQNLTSYSYTTPLYFVIENKKVNDLKNWTIFYVTFVQTLWEKYSDILSDYIGRGWGKSSRIDLNDTDKNMISPKKVTNDLYLETNLNALDIIKKSSDILDICGINKSSVTIAYIERYNDSQPEKHYNRTCRTNNNDRFVQWMIETRNLAPATTRSYRSSINICDSFANNNGIYNGSIIELNADEFDSAYNSLMNNEEFKETNKNWHNVCSAALKVCREYLLSNYASGSTNETSEEVEEDDLEISEEFEETANRILREDFEDGYRIGHYIDRVSFISSYEETGKTLPFADDELDTYLRRVGRIVEDRIFVNDSNSHSELLGAVFDDVEQAFENGATVVYLDCVFERFRKKLSEISLYNPDSLYAIMSTDEKLLKHYMFRKGALTKYSTTPDIGFEVERLIKPSLIPMSLDDIRSQLWHLPADKIKTEIFRNSNIVNVDTDMFFYAPNFSISADEISTLTDALNEQLDESGYIAAPRLRELFRENCPLAAAESENYRDIAIKRILRVFLDNEFEFTPALVTKKGDSLDSKGLFQSFGAEHETLTLSQIREFADDLNINIYWKPLLREVVRVSSSYFVRNDKINFDADAIDQVLDDLCPGNYIALKDISIFLSFPDVGYKWNEFLLESYLREFSKQFKLIQNSFSMDGCYGAMVRNSSNLKTFEDIVTDMLAHRNDWNDEASALECLVNSGLQQRRAYKNISSIIKKAKLIREQLNSEGR